MCEPFASHEIAAEEEARTAPVLVGSGAWLASGI